MSTKCTISYSNSHHFYEEIFDRSNVYLKLDNTQFEASNNSVMVQIPIHIWREMVDNWSKRGWPSDEDNKEEQISNTWIESLEKLVILDKQRGNE